jgi:lipopolysaccharide transport system ATP-binding protein
MSDIAIKIESLSKLYSLGQIGTGTISRDLERWWAGVRGKEDPFAKVGQLNDRSKKGDSDFVWSLSDINFEVKKGEVMGIIGRNGAGKSTLLKILSKITSPTKGRISIDGRIASLLEVGTGFHPEMTGRENIFMNGAILGMRKKEIQKKFDEIVDFAGVAAYVDTPVKRYSSGMTVRLGFAVAAHLEPEILVVDEVLAVGDNEFQKKCIGKMKDISTNGGRTVLFVSHNMGSIQSLCDTAIHLKNGCFVNKGTAKQIVGEYLSDRNNLTNYKTYSKYLKYAHIEQQNDKIILTASYDLSVPVDIPHLGFVIYNNEGIPICASNPTLENLSVDLNRNFSSGKIHVEIIEPKLIDGEYIVSLWFGDSKENYLEDLECLTLEISGMTNNKKYNQSIIGNVVPQTKWVFS